MARRASRLRFAAVLGLITLLAWSGNSEAQQGPRATAVAVDEVRSEVLGETTPVIGRLVARQSGVVAARTAGAVDEVLVDVGDRVRRGDIIAVLANERMRAARDAASAVVRQRLGMLETAQAELAIKAQELRRQQDLQESAAFSKARFEDAEQEVAMQEGELAERQAQLMQAEADLSRAALDFEDTQIQAPFDGIITEKHTDVGAYLSVGNPVVAMVNDLDLEVEAEVPTDRLAGLEPGAVVDFNLDDGTTHTAIVRAVVPQENVLTRTRPVRFTPAFDATERPLAVNQTATVNVPIGSARNVTTVHKDAIVRRGGDAIVFVVADGSSELRPVQLGAASGDRFVVQSGLSVGEQVVTRGNETLQPGQPLNVLNPPAGENGAAPARNGENGPAGARSGPVQASGEGQS